MGNTLRTMMVIGTLAKNKLKKVFMDQLKLCLDKKKKTVHFCINFTTFYAFTNDACAEK